MDVKRIAIYAGLFWVTLLLWSAWQKEHQLPVSTAPTAIVAPNTTTNSITPASGQNVAAPVANSVSQTVSVPDSRLVHVKTDVLDVSIDTLGGNVISAKLLKYPAELHSSDAFTLLNDSKDTLYVAQSGLKTNGQATPEAPIQYKASANQFTLSPDQKTLTVTLQGKNEQGIAVTKTFVFERDNYAVDIAYQLENTSNKAWQGTVYSQLTRAGTTKTSSSMFSIASYTGASMSDPGQKLYKKISYQDMTTNPVDQLVNGGWAAMQQHYFVSALIPPNNQQSRFYTSSSDNQFFSIGFNTPELTLAPKAKTQTNVKLYMGPEVTSRLSALAPGLDLTVDYGLLWFISGPVFSALKFIHGLIGNWGWAIILITCLIKLAFYRLSATSYKSMANMRKLQPRIEALKERFGDDKQKLTQATMDLYRNEKVNPLSGCLPILIQIPVFIALYWVLLESVELRHAPFVFWIHDLSVKDPYYVLPLIMGATMFFQQRLNPPPADPVQAKVMMLLPVMFTVLFLNFPAGLVLYWIVNNTLSIAQQWYINYQVENEATLIRAKR